MRYINHRICSWLAIGAASFAIPLYSVGFAASPTTEVTLAAGTYAPTVSAEASHVISVANQAGEITSDQFATSSVVADIRQSLPSVASPIGAIKNCQEIATLIRASQQSHCLELALRQTCCNGDACCDTLSQQLAHALASKIEDEKIRKGLEAHVVIYSTMMLARQHVEGLDKLDVYDRQQSTALDNGIAVQDPSALARIRIQTTDTAIQTIAVNKNMRSQLSILLKNDIPCDYQPTLEACCVAPLQDLCDLISQAEQNRSELQALRILDAMLCEQTTASCNCCASILNSLSIVAVPCCVQHHGFAARIFGKSKIESQTRALRSTIQAATGVVKDKVASEVTDAWHKSASNQARLVLAQEMADAAAERVSQLNQMSAEVSSSPEVLINAELALLKARGEVIQREQEWQVSLIELAHSTGCL